MANPKPIYWYVVNFSSKYKIPTNETSITVVAFHNAFVIAISPIFSILYNKYAKIVYKIIPNI